MTACQRVAVVTADAIHAVDLLAMVHERAVHEGTRDPASVGEERWHEVRADGGTIVLVAVVDGRAVGFVAATRRLHPWSGEELVAVDDVYVRAPARRTGVGEALLRAVADRFGDGLLRWELDQADLAGQRFSVHLGARLRRAVIATWRPATGVAPPARPTS